MKSVFVDTFAWIGILNKTDNYHHKCNEILKELLNNETKLITTNFVLVETINALSKISFRKSIIDFVNKIETSSIVDIITITEEIYFGAWNLYKQRLDKNWGITDCTSFKIMELFDIKYAFTNDIHFVQAGFINLIDNMNM